MLQVGSRRTWSPVARSGLARGRSRDAKSTLRRRVTRRTDLSVARLGLERGDAGEIYSAVAKLTSGGGDDAEMGAEGRERAHAQIKILAVGSSRACRFIPRVATNAQDLAPRIGQNHPHTKFFTAPARIERLLED
jgi:hypothetical protein